MASQRRVKIATISLIACAVLSILTLFVLFFYYLSYIVTGLGSIILFILLLWSILRLAVKILVFPGSCWFWKRSIEASLCIEMSNQIYYKIRDLRLYLQSIQNQERFSYQTNSPALIDSLLERINSLKEFTKTSKFQERFFINLDDMRKYMKETVVIVNSANSRNIWDWLQERLSYPDPDDVVFEDYPDCLQAKKLIKLCSELEESLYKSCGTVKNMQKVTRWLFDDTLGSIHYLRADLLKRFNCEQIWVTSNKIKIDW